MKQYAAPSVHAVGSVRALTQQGGGANTIDVAFGTPVDLDDPDGFTGFTGS